MPDVEKHQYMHEYPFVCTQAGTRPMTKQEQREAQAYMLGIVEKPTLSMWAVLASGLSIVTGVVVGIAAYLVYLF